MHGVARCSRELCTLLRVPHTPRPSFFFCASFFFSASRVGLRALPLPLHVKDMPRTHCPGAPQPCVSSSSSCSSQPASSAWRTAAPTRAPLVPSRPRARRAAPRPPTSASAVFAACAVAAAPRPVSAARAMLASCALPVASAACAANAVPAASAVNVAVTARRSRPCLPKPAHSLCVWPVASPSACRASACARLCRLPASLLPPRPPPRPLPAP